MPPSFLVDFFDDDNVALPLRWRSPICSELTDRSETEAGRGGIPFPVLCTLRDELLRGERLV